MTGKCKSPEQRHPSNFYIQRERYSNREICVCLSLGVYSKIHIYSENISKCVFTHQHCPSSMFQTTHLFLCLFNEDVLPFMCQTLDMEKNQADMVSALKDLYIKGDRDGVTGKIRTMYSILLIVLTRNRRV